MTQCQSVERGKGGRGGRGKRERGREVKEGGRGKREGKEPCFTYLAVVAVLGARMACSIEVIGPDCVPGLMNPVTGRPVWETGLAIDNN